MDLFLEILDIFVSESYNLLAEESAYLDKVGRGRPDPSYTAGYNFAAGYGD